MRGIHHLHLRKRLEPFPASTGGKRFLDAVVFISGVVGPLMTIPQVLEIYAHHNAAGVSILTWGAYALFDIPWIIYGIVHREAPIIITYLLWFLFNSLVVLGVVLYA